MCWKVEADVGSEATVAPRVLFAFAILSAYSFNKGKVRKYTGPNQRKNLTLRQLDKKWWEVNAEQKKGSDSGHCDASQILQQGCMV